MKNQSLKKLALLGVLVASSVQATEIRTPWISEHGPLRYTFEKLHEDCWNFNWWTAGHFKEAHKAFMKHGTKSRPYTELIFNKSEFTLNEIFPDSQVPLNAENFSPFLKLTKVKPRAEYTEYGVTFGARVDFPVWCKGRVGLRTTVPFRRIKVERTDTCCDQDTDPLAPFVARKVIRIDRNSAVNDVGAGANDAQAAATDADANVATAQAATRVAPGDNTIIQALGDAIVAAGPANIGVDFTNASEVAIALISDGKEGGLVIGDLANPAAINTADATASQVVTAVVASAASLGGFNTAQVQAEIGLKADLINAAADRGDRASSQSQIDMVVTAYNMAFVASLPNSQLESAIQPANNAMNIFNNNVAVTTPDQKNRSTVGVTKAANVDELESKGFVAWMTANEQSPIKAHTLVDAITEIGVGGPAPSGLNNLPTEEQVGVFDISQDYSPLGVTPVTGLRPIESDPTLWLTFRRAADSADPERFSRDPLNGPGAGGAIARQIENLLQLFNQNPFAFFDSQGFDLETSIRSGLGDIDLDLFYEHTFNDDWIGEVWVGVRLPTGSGKDFSKPYRPNLGNGEHWEVKIGGLIAWQPLCWMNVKVDAMYSFVLENTETRAAAFKGATIKNFGPATKADVDWGYFVGHVDFNFFHPCTDRVRSMIGYEFYYKTKDRLSFKNKELESWLGGTVDPVTGLIASNPKPLDNDLARKNTESIAHKVRWETSCQINDYFEIFAGASTTFAGQYVARDRDAHVGYNIRF